MNKASEYFSAKFLPVSEEPALTRIGRSEPKGFGPPQTLLKLKWEPLKLNGPWFVQICRTIVNHSSK